MYISRSRARCRLVVKEDEIIPVLHEFGFEVVHFEEFPWERQLEIISEAIVIIGPTAQGSHTCISSRRDPA